MGKGNFLSLLSAENMKLWKRISSLIMLIVLVVCIVGLSLLVKFVTDYAKSQRDATTQTTSSDSSSSNSSVKVSSSISIDSDRSGSNWKQVLQAEISSDKVMIATAEKSDKYTDKTNLDSIKKQVAEDQYRIDHNIKPSDKEVFWKYMSVYDFSNILALFVIIAATALVAGEFSDNTMKTMISRPFARWQILTAKLLATFGYSLVLFAAMFITNGVVTAILYGTGGFGSYEFMWLGGSIHYVPGALLTLFSYFLNFLGVLVYALLAFALSAVSRSRALATGISIVLFILGGSITGLLLPFFSWSKFILFADTSFSTFITSGGIYDGLTLGFSALMSVIYCAVFLFAGYFTFAKRDIA